MNWPVRVEATTRLMNICVREVHCLRTAVRFAVDGGEEVHELSFRAQPRKSDQHAAAALDDGIHDGIICSTVVQFERSSHSASWCPNTTLPQTMRQGCAPSAVMIWEAWPTKQAFTIDKCSSWPVWSGETTRNEIKRATGGGFASKMLLNANFFF